MRSSQGIVVDVDFRQQLALRDPREKAIKRNQTIVMSKMLLNLLLAV